MGTFGVIRERSALFRERSALLKELSAAATSSLEEVPRALTRVPADSYLYPKDHLNVVSQTANSCYKRGFTNAPEQVRVTNVISQTQRSSEPGVDQV